MHASAVAIVLCLTAFVPFSAVALEADQPTTLRDLQDFYSAVPDEANAALIYRKAIDMCADGYGGVRVPPGGMQVSRDVLVTPLNPQAKANLVKELEKDAPILEILHQASTLTRCRFPIDLTHINPHGYCMDFSHLVPMRCFTWILELKAVVAADDKNADSAVQALMDAIAVAQSLSNEPLLLSQETRIACWYCVLDSLQQILNRVCLNEETLLHLQGFLSMADDRRALTRALQAELCIYMNLGKNPQEKKELEEYVDEAREKVEESKLPYCEIVKLLPPPYDPKKWTPEQFEKEVIRTPGNKHFPAFRTFLREGARMAAKAAAAQGVVAIERFRLKHGKLPEKWADLVPDFLAAPIQDPFVEGATLILHITDDSYRVYSVGQDQKDDGGKEGDSLSPLDHGFRIEREIAK